MTHELKTWPQYFEPVNAGRKRFEIRKNDRGFQIGDTLILKEWCPKALEFTGRSTVCRVTYMTDFEQKPGFVVMGLAIWHR